MLLAGCTPAGPHWESRCTASHSEGQWVYWPAEEPGIGITPYGAGIHVGGGMHYVERTVCDARDSVWVKD